MCDLISASTPTARKDHGCMAYDWIDNCFDLEDLTPDEQHNFLQAKGNKGMIKKGTKYIRQCLNDGGRLFTFKAIPELHKICLKYDMYEC